MNEFVNGFAEEARAYSQDKSAEMISLFFLHSDDDDILSDKGVAALKEVFERVNEPLRQSVFEGFIELLDEYGVDYDVEKFK